MITQTTIDRLNVVNDLMLSFETALVTIESPTDVIAASTIYMDSVIKELSLDCLKRDGT